jgi:hypothetical protein
VQQGPHSALTLCNGCCNGCHVSITFFSFFIVITDRWLLAGTL